VNLLLITFALRNKLRDYDSFFVAIRGNALQWWHYIETSYVVVTTYGPTEMANRLALHIEPTDSILVIPVTAPMNGWLPPEAWTWLTTKLSEVERQKLLSG
jgi:hypothetical protein